MDNLNHDFIPGRIAADDDAKPARPQEWRTSKAGEVFDLHADDWKLNSKSTLYLEPLREMLRPFPTLTDGAIRTLAWFAENQSPNRTMQINRALKQFLTVSPSSRDMIQEPAVVNFRDQTRRRDGHDGNGMQLLRPILTQWHALGFPGVSDALVERINGWTLTGYERNARVNRRDANAGPLEPAEQHGVQLGALRAYENRQLTTAEYTTYVLIDLTGRRPEQLVRLKWKDLDDTRIEDPVPGEAPKRVLLLSVPRLKGKRKWRDHFRAVPLVQDDWNLLQLLRLETRQRFEDLLRSTGLTLQDHDRQFVLDELPIFPGWIRLKRSLDAIKALAQAGRHGDAIARLRADAASTAWESDFNHIKKLFAKVAPMTGVKNCDGEPIHLFATRMRYTLEANLFRLGVPDTVRAFNLDHDTLASLIDYSKNSADRASRWSAATRPQMARLASYFKIKLVDHEADAVAGDDPEQSRLLVANADAGATCAVKRSCGMGQIPRCCYNGCDHFQPWLDGPHEAFLAELLVERDDFLAHLDPLKERATIEAADTLILAVAAVIYQCDERRRELEAQPQPKRGRSRK
ncbi:MAG: hypothetical protein NDI91_19840 [Sulfuritalea sp.]|nr:hypothetical protein [Sulfuritalea sp.]